LSVVGHETVWPGAAPRSSAEVTDSPASTILIVENLGADVPWMEPRDLSFDAMDFAIPSPDGVSSPYIDPAVVMLDGSLHQLRKDLPANTLQALLTVAGGEHVHEHDGQWTLLLNGRNRPLAPR
jgi:hypothetical protein